MKTTFSHILCCLFILTVAACNSAGTSDSKKQENTVSVPEAKYFCPMKCEGGTSDKPGKCPVCEMDLIETASIKGTPAATDSHSTVNHSH